MIWVGSFKSLQSAVPKPHFVAALEVHTWLQREIALITLFVDWLDEPNRLILFGCRREEFVELALREAVSNAMLHGNRLEARKLVHVRCCCESATGVSIVVRDQGGGFNASNVPDPLAIENLPAVYRRGIHLMKLAADEISFAPGGTPGRYAQGIGKPAKNSHPADREAHGRRPVIRPWPVVRAVDLVDTRGG